MPTKRRPPAAKPVKGKRGGNRGGGRPSAYDQAIANEICDALASGESLRSILKKPGMPDGSTIYAWIRRYEDFAKAYAAARVEQSERYAEEIIEIADTDPDPKRARVRVDARKWIASKLMPKKYGEKVDVQIGGEMVVRGMTDEQLDAKVQQLLARAAGAMVGAAAAQDRTGDGAAGGGE